MTQIVSLGFVGYLCSSRFLRALRKNTAQLGLLYLLIMKAYLCLNPQQYMERIERKSGEAKRSEEKRGRTYRKIPKISPGAYIFQRPFLRGLSTEGNLRFKIDWANLIVGSKFTVFALFYFVFVGNFPSTSPQGAYIWWGDLTEGFLRYWFGGLIFGGAIFGILQYLQLLKLKGYSSYLMADQTSAKESALLSLKMKEKKINIDSISGLKLAWEERYHIQD